VRCVPEAEVSGALSTPRGTWTPDRHSHLQIGERLVFLHRSAEQVENRQLPRFRIPALC